MDSKHVCMLSSPPACADAAPTESFCRRLKCQARLAKLAASWHAASARFIRSRKSLALEQKRQILSPYRLVWHPYSPIRFYWDCFDLTVILFTYLYVPLQVFYYCPDPYAPAILFCDLMSFLDMCANFNTGYAHDDNKQVILDPKEIAKHYLRGVFIFDLIGTLPLQVIQPFKNCKYPSHTIMFVFKLSRLPALKRKWSTVLEQIRLSYVKAELVTTTARLIMFFHWMTYLNYQVPAFCAHLYTMDDADGRKERMWLMRHKVALDNVPVFKRYVTNLYSIAGLCIGAGYYSPVDKHVIPEMLLTATMGIVGLIYLTYSVMGLLRLAIYKQNQKYLYNGRLKEIENYMVMRRLPKYLQQKIMFFINYKFNGGYFNEQSIINTLNEQIKQDINMHCCRHLVASVPLFAHMPVALTNTIIFSLKHVLYMPGEVIMKCRQPDDSMYIISSGTVVVLNKVGRELTHFKDGAFFGERALLNSGIIRHATVIALEITEIYQLNSKDFQRCIQPYPHLKRRVEQLAKSSLTSA